MDIDSITEPVRRMVADAVRGRVVGDNADQRAVELFSAEGERWRSEEHTSELQSRLGISYAVFCLKKKKK